MKNDLSTKFCKKRRGLSNIIGSLVVLGIVAAVGSVVLFHGLDEISAFSYDLNAHDKAKNNALREDLVIEHVRFQPNTSNVSIHLGNIGTVESQIVSVMILKLDTQELVVEWEDVNSNILIKDNQSIQVTATLDQGSQTWNDSYYLDSDYRVSITTVNGNFFTTIAGPFNN